MRVLKAEAKIMSQTVRVEVPDDPSRWVEVEFRTLRVRTARVIYDDETGEELARSSHRESLQPDTDVSGRSDLIKNVAATV